MCVFAHCGAKLRFLSDKAPSIFQFRPHVMIVHLGLFDLVQFNADPLLLAERYWHVVALLRSYISGSFQAKVIFVGQPRFPAAVRTGNLYGQRRNSFHLELLSRAEGFRSFSFLFLDDQLNNFHLGGGMPSASLRDIPPCDLPFHMLLSILRNRVASLLAHPSEYYFPLLFADV